MSDDPKPKPIFWAALFITAFALGAILWALWMVRVIRQTREARDSPEKGFLVPMATNPPAASAPAAVQKPAAGATNFHP
jgi:hypothetical protein